MMDRILLAAKGYTQSQGGMNTDELKAFLRTKGLSIKGPRETLEGRLNNWLETTGLQGLPMEIHELIGSYLSDRDLLNLSLTNKRTQWVLADAIRKRADVHNTLDGYYSKQCIGHVYKDALGQIYYVSYVIPRGKKPGNLAPPDLQYIAPVMKFIF